MSSTKSKHFFNNFRFFESILNTVLGYVQLFLLNFNKHCDWKNQNWREKKLNPWLSQYRNLVTSYLEAHAWLKKSKMKKCLININWTHKQQFI
jgi:hypothetical protein